MTTYVNESQLPPSNQSVFIHFEEVYQQYNQVTAAFRLTVIGVFFVICFFSVLVLTGIFASCRYVRVWTHHLVCTYSLIAADLWTTLLMMCSIATSVNISPMLLNTLNELCIPVILEALRLGSMLCTLLHVMLLAWQHLLAFYPPMTCHRLVKVVLGKAGLAVVWIVPSGTSVSLFVIVGRSSYGCFSEVFLGDDFRSGVVGVMAVPIAITLALYSFLVLRMHYQAHRDVKAAASAHQLVMGLDSPGPCERMLCMEALPSEAGAGAGGAGSTDVLRPSANGVAGDADAALPECLNPRSASETRRFSLLLKKRMSLVGVCQWPPTRQRTDSRVSTTQYPAKSDLSAEDAVRPRSATVTSSRRLDSRRSTMARSDLSPTMPISSRPSAVRRRQKTTYFALTLLLLFVASWAPTMVWFSILCQTCPYPQIVLMISHPWVLAVGSALTNAPLYLRLPINAWMYAFRLPEVRSAMKRICRRREQMRSNRSRFLSDALLTRL